MPLVATNYDRTLKDNLISPNLPGLPKVNLLKAIALYGANASGKSNILSGLHFMRQFIRHSRHHEPNEAIYSDPFKMDPSFSTLPGSFEIMFVANNTRYLYGFSLTKERVEKEYLSAFPKGKERKYFERSFEKNKYIWEFNKRFFYVDTALQEKVRDNNLLLGVGAEFNHEELTIIYNWFKKNLRIMDLGRGHMNPKFTVKQLLERKSSAPEIIKLLQAADSSILDVDANLEEVPEEKIKNFFPKEIVEKLKSENRLKDLLERVSVQLKHKSSIENSFIDIDDESDGTRRIFEIAGPWLDILQNGYTIVVDELETSLHPNLVKELLKLFFNPKTNPKGAQIIFSTHNSNLLNQDLIRRDQVWFTEKDDSGQTNLYPLTTYKPRNEESIEKGYLAGRYGAVPYLPGGIEIEPKAS